MRMPRFLLLSVSMFVLAGSAGIALAQDAGRVVIGGTLGRVAAPNDLARGIAGGNYELTEIDYDDPYASYVSGVLGYRFGNGWDIVGRLSTTRAGETLTEFDYNSGSYSGEIGTEFEYQTLDIEAGYTPELDDNLEVRFAAGLRALTYSDQLSVRDKIGGWEETSAYENSFAGVGPRVTVDIAARIPDGAFGISASAAGSVVAGKLDWTTDDGSGSDDKLVTTLEAKVAGDYHIENVGKLSLGYRAEMIADLHEFDHSNAVSRQVTHGPVLEFLGGF
jgi:hypothetical protein